MYLDDLFDDGEDLPEKLKKQARTASSSFLPGRDEGGDEIDWGSTGAIDYVLQGRTIAGAENSVLQQITDQGRAAAALPLPVTAGTRVSFTHNVGAVLGYPDIPPVGVEGTVVTVRSSLGDVTASQQGVHVLWDDGQFRAIAAEHLRRAKLNKKVASTMRISFVDFESSGIGDLFALAKSGSTDLIHKATKDLWSFRQDGDQYVIERLFDEDGSPLKV